LVGVLAAVLAWVGAAASTPVSASSSPSEAAHQAAPVALAPGGDVWHWQNPAPDAESLFALSCPTTSACFAAGADGIVRATTNAGAAWSQQDTVGGEIFGMSCTDASHCVGVGVSTGSIPGSGFVIATSDAGTSWTQLTLANTQTLFGVSCPTTTNCIAVGAAGEILVDSSGTWSTHTPPTTSTLSSVTCPSATECFTVAVTGGIFRTTDGGSTWTGQNSNTTTTLNGVACPSTTSCDVVGAKGLFLETTDSGATWNLLTNQGSSLYGLSCPDTTHCFAAAADGMVYFQDPSSSPLGRASTPERGALFGISCPSLTECLAVGSYGIIVATTNGGTAWAKQATAIGPVRGLSCPDATHCFASGWIAGDAGYVTLSSDAGATWTTLTQLPTGTPSNLESISCPDLSHCVAVGTGGTIIATSDGGAHWSSQASSATVVLFGVSCPSSLVCYAGGQNGTMIATTDGGAHWSAQASGMTGEITGISCPTVTRCFASISNIIDPVMGTTSGPGEIITTGDGLHWSLSFNLANDPSAGSTAPFNAIDCPSTTSCYAVGNSGLIAATSDGVTWRTDTPPSPTWSGQGISCPTTSVCYAAGSNDMAIAHTTNSGGTWTTEWGGVFGEAWQGIRCVSTSTCIAVGGMFTRTTTGGAAWTQQAPTGSSTYVAGLACTDSINCYAVGGDTFLVTHNGGVSWSTHTLSTTDQVLGISCPVAGTCVAVGWPGAIYTTTDAGTTWTYKSNPFSGADETLTSVSCATATTCVAVGTDGKVISTTNGGSTWSLESSGTTRLLMGVSCASTYWCVAVGQGGTSLTRAGGTWHTYASGTTKDLSGVDCPTASICYAAGDGGTIIKTGDAGGTWNALTSDTTVLLLAIKCPTTTVCLAAGRSATAILTLDGSSWSDDSPPGVNTLYAVAWGDLNNAWLGGAGGTIFINRDVTGACGSVSGGALPNTPQPKGTVVTISATANGCANPTYEIWMLPPGGTWTLLSGWSKNATFAWDSSSGTTGSYHFSVWARDLTSSNSYDSFFAFDYVLTVVMCTGISVTGSPSQTSVQRGQPEQFAASSTGCPNPRYEFWLLPPGGTWTLAQAYSATPSFNWSTFVPEGVYRFSIWVRDASDSNPYDAFSAFPFTITGSECTGMSATASPTSPTTRGMTPMFTGTATGCPHPLYEFWLRMPTGDWLLASAYSADNNWDWSTSGQPAGTYRISIWARDSSSSAPYDAFSAFDYVLNPAPPCTAVTAPPSPASPQNVSTAVSITASATGCSSPLYEFWLLPPGGTWTLEQS